MYEVWYLCISRMCYPMCVTLLSFGSARNVHRSRRLCAPVLQYTVSRRPFLPTMGLETKGSLQERLPRGRQRQKSLHFSLSIHLLLTCSIPPLLSATLSWIYSFYPILLSYNWSLFHSYTFALTLHFLLSRWQNHLFFFPLIPLHHTSFVWVPMAHLSYTLVSLTLHAPLKLLPVQLNNLSLYI